MPNLAETSSHHGVAEKVRRHRREKEFVAVIKTQRYRVATIGHVGLHGFNTSAAPAVPVIANAMKQQNIAVAQVNEKARAYLGLIM